MADEKKSKHKLIIGIFVVLLLMSAIGICTGGNKNTSTSSSAESTSNSAASAEAAESSTASNSNESEASNSQSSTSAEVAKSEATTDKINNQNGTELTKKKNIPEKYDNEIIASSKMMLDRFISNYDISLAPQKWTIAMWDDEAVIALTDVVLAGNSAKQTAIVVLTPIFEGDKMTGATPHFVSVGDTVYGDDGYCNDVFAKLQEIDAAQG